MTLLRAPILLALVAVLALGACGQSKQDKAKNTVCDARADLSKQVDHLKSLTISTATTSDVQQSLKAIGDDLNKIKNAQGDLADQRRKEVQAANQAFTSQVQAVVSNVGKNLSLSNAQAQLTAAVQQLATAYQQTFAKVNCS
ncbi:MAG: hypothetical protein ACXVFK_18335 [Solirubrobacteraceae bacterium]